VGGGGECLIKDLKRKANSLSRNTRQANAVGLGGDPRPSGTAPLGMTKTPTLRVSTDLLDGGLENMSLKGAESVNCTRTWTLGIGYPILS